jgi:hypothetical protein
MENGSWVRWGLIGSADILGLANGGKFIALEVKTGCGVQSDQQVKFESAVKKTGGHYFVVRSVEDALQFVAQVAAPASVE